MDRELLASRVEMLEPLGLVAARITKQRALKDLLDALWRRVHHDDALVRREELPGRPSKQAVKGRVDRLRSEIAGVTMLLAVEVERSGAAARLTFQDDWAWTAVTAWSAGASGRLNDIPRLAVADALPYPVSAAALRVAREQTVGAALQDRRVRVASVGSPSTAAHLLYELGRPATVVDRDDALTEPHDVVVANLVSLRPGELSARVSALRELAGVLVFAMPGQHFSPPKAYEGATIEVVTEGSSTTVLSFGRARLGAGLEGR